MEVFDFLLSPIYLLIFYVIARRIVTKNSNNPIYARYYIRGLNYKFVGSFGFAVIYLFYYRGGDTINFFYTVQPTFKLFFDDPVAFFSFIFSPKAPYPPQCIWDAARHGVIYLLRGSPTLTTIRIASFLNIFSLNSYMVLGLFFAFISYQFQWRAFVQFTAIYPMLHRNFAIAFLMVPSVLFWGSGLSKDSIMIGAIMLFFCSYYSLVISKQKRFRNLILLICTGYVIGLIRGFILFTMVPCLWVMTITFYRNSINSSFLRFLIGPFLIITAIGTSILFFRGVGQAVQSYSVESLQQKAEGFKSWHTYLGETHAGTSAYSLGGNVEYSASGILRETPTAIITTLYGPFLWQIRSPVMLLSGLESLVCLYFSLTIFFNRRIYSLFGVIFKDHLINFCIPFILILGVAIGLTSFNYGALVRYKIPILPFFGVVIILINYHLQQSNTSEIK